MTTHFERAFAAILIIIGVMVIIFAVFQAFFYEKEVSVFGETLREEGITELEGLGHNSMWLFTLLTELVCGFFLAAIGTRIIRS